MADDRGGRRIHDNQIELYGGLPGFKDPGLVDSAAHAPLNAFGYDEERDLLMPALVLCRAIAKNHGFLDGNKRTATASMILFLAINGYDLIVTDGDPDEPWLGHLVENLALSCVLDRVLDQWVTMTRRSW